MPLLKELPGASAPACGAVVVWPRDACQRYGITGETRRRWERQGLLPPRDFFLAGEAVGWHLQTLELADRGMKPE